MDTGNQAAKLLRHRWIQGAEKDYTVASGREDQKRKKKRSVNLTCFLKRKHGQRLAGFDGDGDMACVGFDGKSSLWVMCFVFRSTGKSVGRGDLSGCRRYKVMTAQHLCQPIVTGLGNISYIQRAVDI